MLYLLFEICHVCFCFSLLLDFICSRCEHGSAYGISALWITVACGLILVAVFLAVL